MELATLDFIQSLPISDEQRSELIEKIDWEKELSWSDGYDTAVDEDPRSVTNRAARHIYEGVTDNKSLYT